jgi:hypothetical protein
MAADPGDELFDLPPEEFVAARDALAKRLKADGDKEASAAVKALRRPTVAAWAVNQVARSTTGRKDIATLLQVGDRLRDAHDALLEGKGDAGIREATAERRQLVAKLTKAAIAHLGAGGEAQHDAISHTFDAAVADPDAGLAVRAGRLSKELDAPSGFGGGLIFGADPAAAPARSTRPRREERRAARQARRGDATPEPAGAPVPPEAVGDDEPAPVPAPKGPTAAERKAAERRRQELQREADERATEAQQAAREAAAARQEVSRLQDLLVTANAKAKAAADHAQLAQWKAATAQQALRDADTDQP